MARDRKRDPADQEGFAVDWAIVIEKNAIRGAKIVGLPVVERDPLLHTTASAEQEPRS